ncbi:MAG: ATP-binding protein [Treponema sp.]|nr:ATP-binding protein [Treponema sp.]
MKRLLPIGMQDFAAIRKEGFCYVDKTARIHQLITGSGKQFFLSRPRRFGKSLLCSTLRAIFEGRRELFGEICGFPALAINSLEWSWKKHPVIRLDLSAGTYSNGTDELYSVLSRELKREAEKLEIVLDDKNYKNQFASLIEKSSKKMGEKAVVIIDEYDKPMFGTIDEPSIHKKIREELKGFYGILKSYDEYLQFVFLTGVTKFSHVSIFSDLNHLTDLTLDPRYSDICGITQEETEQNFMPEIDAIIAENGINKNEYMEKLRCFYNGYRFSEKPLTVYNTFGLLHHFYNNGAFLPYWYESGSPDFLIKLIALQKIDVSNLENMQIGYESFRKYDVENIEAEPILYQTGYLTISDFDKERNKFTLDYPNLEVRSSFSKSLIKQYLKAPADKANTLLIKLPDALLDGNIEETINVLRQFLASIPYDIIKETENYYETAIHLVFTMLGFNCRSEVRIASGRIDTLVETKSFVYCFEFKLNGTAQDALAQINSKEYLLPWQGSGKKLFKIGIEIDREKRNIGEWMCEAYS